MLSSIFIAQPKLKFAKLKSVYIGSSELVFTQASYVLSDLIGVWLYTTFLYFEIFCNDIYILMYATILNISLTRLG